MRTSTSSSLGSSSSISSIKNGPDFSRTTAALIFIVMLLLVILLDGDITAPSFTGFDSASTGKR